MKAQQQAEFREWAAAARPRLRRTGYLLCGDWHLAEDLAQDALERVCGVWPRVSASGRPDAYAMKTLVNAHRAAARRPWRREHAVENPPDRHDPGGSADRTADGYRDVLLAALAELGPSQRAVVVLRYWEDLPVAEVARLLSISPGTVKSQAARALDHLRAVIELEPAPALPNGEPS